MKTLREINPVAADMWYYELNGDMTPDNTPGKSGKIAYFQCRKNPKHIFQKKIYAMTAPDGSNRGCLYCDGRVTVAFPGETDFFTMVPEAKVLWDFDKNEGLDPYTLLPGSTVRANFKCSRGHEFNRQIQNITESPYCKICYLEDNNITKTNPELLDWWNYKKNGDVKPEQFTKASCKKVWWECPKCHFEWQAEIATRVISKGMCPCCEARLYVKTGVNDMFSLVPDIKMDFDFERNKGIDYNNIKISSTQKIFWKCHTCGYKWKASPSSRISPNEDGTYCFNSCPACVKNARLIPFYEEYPKLYEKFDKHANPLPIDAYKISCKEKLWWNCFKCGELFQCTIRSMIRGYNTSSEGCTYCSGSKVSPKKSFGYLHPECIDEYDPNNEFNAYEVSEKSSRKARWICRNDPNHRWIASFQARARGFGTCPECQSREYGKMLHEERPDLKELFDMERNHRSFESYTYVSNKKVHWKCEHGKRAQIAISNIIRKTPKYCHVCGIPIITIGENDFASKFPELAKQFDTEKNGFSADELLYNSKDESIWWTCEKGHSYQRSPYYRWHDASACPICKRTQIVSGVNDLQSRYPFLPNIWDFEKNELEPTNISDKNTDAYWFKCKENHSYSAKVPIQIQYKDSCLVCLNKVFLKGINSYADAHPELVNEWSPNNRRKPQDVLCSLHLEIKWICPDCSYEYTYPMHLREKGKTVCPACLKYTLIPNINSFAVKGEKGLINQWSPNNEDTPWDVFYDSPKYKKWICPDCNGEYKYPIRARRVGDDSCPYCNNRKVLAGLNSLADVNEKLTEEWSPNNVRKPTEFLRTSTYPALWNCPTCHGEYAHPIKNREVGDDSCPYCNNRKPLMGFNTLETIIEDIDTLWSSSNDKHYAEILPTSGYNAEWKCKKCNGIYNEPVNTFISAYLRGESNCPYCKNKKPLLGFNTLETVLNDIDLIWSNSNSRNYTELLPSSGYFAEWICGICGGQYFESVNTFVPKHLNNEDDCPYCNNRRPLSGFNTLKVKCEQLMKEWNYRSNYLIVNPDAILPTYPEEVWWTCECGRNYKMSPQKRLYYQKRNMKSCPYCKGRRRKKYRHF